METTPRADRTRQSRRGAAPGGPRRRLAAILLATGISGLTLLVLGSCAGRGREGTPFASPRPRIGDEGGSRASSAWAGAIGKPYRDLRRHTQSPLGEVWGIDVSPDGGTLLYASTQDGPSPNLFLKREGEAGMIRKTSGRWRDIHPRFSPDGRSIAFASDRDGNFDIRIVPAEGAGGTEQVTSSPDDEVHPSWSPDGARLAFCRLSPRHGWSIWVLDRRGGTAVELGPGMNPEWSPTGDWIAFEKPSDREPRWFGIWTVRPDASELRQVVAGDSSGAIEPAWSPTGELLAFTSVEGPAADSRRGTGGRIWVVEMAHGEDVPHHRGAGLRREPRLRAGRKALLRLGPPRRQGRLEPPPAGGGPVSRRAIASLRRAWRAAPGVLALLAGCRAAGFYLDNPANPIPGVRRIAVAPVTSPGSADPLRLGELLAGELVQFPGVEVVHPAAVQAQARKGGLVLTDERSVRALARQLGADAVLLAELTEHNPYPPPRIAIAAQLVFARAAASDARAVIDLSAEGQARPVTVLDRCDLIGIEKVYDGSHRETRDQAAYYARGHYLRGEAIEGADRVLRLPELYFRFVSNRLVRDIFEEYRERATLASAGGRG